MRIVTLELGVGVRIAVLTTVISVLTSTAHAVRFYASFADDESIGGVDYLEEDIVLIEDASITVYQSAVGFFTQDEDVDALFVDGSGNIYFSTSAGATIAGGVDGGAGGIDSGDILRYNAATMDFALFIADAGPNIDAFWIENDVPYLSLSVDGTVGSNNLAVLDDEVFTLTGPGTGLADRVATSILDSNDYLLDPGEEPETDTDIDAFAITDDGKYLFSSSGSNSFALEGGGSVTRDSGVIYILDPNNTASFDAREESSIYFDASAVFGTGVNIDALHFLPSDAPEVDADFNGDTLVDAADYTVWRDSLGATGLTAFDLGDANGDGNVTEADYDLWKQAFDGSTVLGMAEFGALDVATVPEPRINYLAGMVGLVWIVGVSRHNSRRA